ncbi:hypothetical protein EVAR_18469_1 [Eumeta japonica]|uniref:Uncharacterized protein n=1 Tax=Eumeta variegata TaxID=151549 RepID=A0A4C1V0B0_EUMVA|nr:hypothetical protein EVAR_18469_1 [Eumeta japonica]
MHAFSTSVDLMRERIAAEPVPISVVFAHRATCNESPSDAPVFLMGKRACELLKSRWSPLSTDTRNFRRNTSAEKGVGYRNSHLLDEKQQAKTFAFLLYSVSISKGSCSLNSRAGIPSGQQYYTACKHENSFARTWARGRSLAAEITAANSRQQPASG